MWNAPPLTGSPAARGRMRRTIFAAVLVGVVLAIYAPVMIDVYGAADDFPTFFPVDDHILRIYRADGRPVLELLLQSVGPWVETLGDLRLLRGVSVLGIGLLGLALYRATRRLFPEDGARLAVVIAICCLPALTVFAAWATVWSYAWGAALAVIAGGCSWHAARRATASHWGRAAWLAAISSMMLVTIFWTYQPLVSWFWLVGLISLLEGRFVRRRWVRRQWCWFTAVGIAQMGICFVALKLFLLVGGVEAKERVQLLSDPLAKVVALARTTAPMVLAQWQVIDVNRKPLMLAISGGTSGLIILVGGYLFLRRQWQEANRPGVPVLAGWLAAVSISLALAHIHGLAVDVNVKNYRTVGALSVGVTLLLFWSLRQFVECLPGTAPRSLRHGGTAAVLALMAAAVARQNLEHYWTRPYGLGFEYLVTQLEEGLTPQTRQIHLIRQTVDDGIVTERAIHSFGRPLSEPEWVMPGLVIAALRESSEPRRFEDFVISDSLDPAQVPPGDDVLVIDMRRLKQFRQGTTGGR